MPEPTWPGPCSYCTLEHGGALFPDLQTRLASGSLDPYALFAVARKTLCTTIRHSKIACDPERCTGRMAGAITAAQGHEKPLMIWGWHVKDLSRDYRAEAQHAASRQGVSAAFAEVLKGFGFDDDDYE